MFKVIGYDADLFGWTFVSRHSGHQEARAAWFAVKAQRVFLWVALVQVRVNVSDGASEIEVVECDAPNAQNLPNVEDFRTAALANR